VTKDDGADVTPAKAEDAIEGQTVEDTTDADTTDGDTTDVEHEADEPESDEPESDEPESDEPESDDNVLDDDEVSAPERGPLRRVLVPLVLAVLLLASVGVATWAYLSTYRPDQQTNAAVAARVVQAASDGTKSILSYAPDSMDKDFANAKSHLTGDFLNYYTQFTQDIVAPAVKTKAVKTSAAVVRSAVAQLHPDSAEVLLFVNQTTQSKENPDGAFAASSVKVGLVKVGNDWLISTFDPV
jgi:Mce-associated membrane protein